MHLTRRHFLKGSLAATASAVSTGGYAFGVEPFRLTVTSYALTPKTWAHGPALKIAVLADIHACEPWMSAERIHSIAQQTNALEPDVIVLLGDYVASHQFITGVVQPQAWAEALAVLKAPLGVYAILGNHDWWWDLQMQTQGHPSASSRHALEKAGIAVLENEAVRLKKEGLPFWIAGLGDQLAFRHGGMPYRAKGGADDLPGTLKRLTDESPAILLAHEPDIFVQVPSRFALTLCGHTHGGQVRLLGYSPITPSQFGNRYTYGHVVEKDRHTAQEKHLIISGGLGCSGVPVRFGVPPEIVMVELGNAPLFLSKA